MTKTLCGANSYNKKYYLDPAFARLPQEVKDELQIMCVTFTEEVGGIILVEFDDDRLPRFCVEHSETDARFDEIGAGLKTKQLAEQKAKLMQQITFFYRVFVCGEKPEEAARGLDMEEVLDEFRKGADAGEEA